MKKIVALTMAVLLGAALCVPVFAASPSTSTVMTTPVSVPTAVVAAKGLVLSEAEQKAVATTPEQAVALAAGVVAETTETLPGGVLFGAVPADPAMIALAKADLLKNATLQKNLQKAGVTGLMAASGQLLYSDGRKGKKTVNLSALGIMPGEKVVFLVYTPGDPSPRVIKATWKNGKLRAKLPGPCNYSIIR